MPFINNTGITDTSQYVLGRGTLFFAVNDAQGLPKAFRFLGNASAFTYTPEVEVLEHFASTSGLKVLDKRVILSQKVSLAFTLEEINADNVALMLSGEVATPANASVAGFSILTTVATGDIEKGT